MIFPAYNPDPASVTVTIDLFIFGFIVLFVFINLFSLFLIRIFMMPKFDQKFRDILWMRYGRKTFGRCYWYATGVSSPIGFKGRGDFYKKVFGDYDFKSHANQFERIISYIYIISMYLCNLMILLFGIHYLIYCIDYWAH